MTLDGSKAWMQKIRSGWAEMAKHALIKRDVDQTIPAIISTTPYLDYLTQFIESSAAVKMDITSRDELETGERAMLNLGHTTYHAMESLAHRNTRTLLTVKA